MSKNICNVCMTENEPEYIYCKNCGALLTASASGQSSAEPHRDNAGGSEYSVNGSNRYSEYQNPQHSEPNPNNGVSAEEMMIFIEKNSADIIPKFTKMQYTGSKTSWCWPPFILGLIFGPMGSAIWFFYRKMFKPAFIFALIGFLSTAAFATLRLLSGIDPASALSSLEADNLYNVPELFYEMSAGQMFLAVTGYIIRFLSNIVTVFISGLSGLWFYKNHCVNKIIRLRQYGGDPAFYKMALSSTGGTSGGLAVLGVLILSFGSVLANAIANIVNQLLT